MTFLEAAFEVLRREGRPLHFKELTRLALKYELLSVVGRDPEEMMQSRLQAEARRPATDLLRVSPGVFGLRNMPLRASKGRPAAEGTATTEETVDENTAAKSNDGGSNTAPTAESASSRRRRGGSGKTSPQRHEAGSEAPASAESQREAPAKSPETDEKPAAASSANPPRDSHRRGSRRSRDEQRAAGADSGRGASGAVSASPAAVGPALPPTVTEANQDVASKPPEPPLAPSAAVPASPNEPTKTATAEAVLPSVHAAPPAPLAPPAPEPAPSRATPVTREQAAPTLPTRAATAEAAVAAHPVAPAAVAVPPSTPASAPSAQSPRPSAAPSGSTPMPSAAEKPAQPSAAPGGTPQPAGPRLMTLADAAYDVLRGSSDGRPLAGRQIAEIALKRRLVRGELNDIARALRGALVREQRQRDSEGLRPRMRTAGPGQYALGERKLEPELYTAERDLMDRLSRTREATRVALRRRLRSMAAGPFELLMRLVLERMGMVSPDLIKRGDGVAYFGGTLSRGTRQIRLLVAIRPGDSEIPREAIGELRAGIRMRGFDEGLLLASARLSAAALAEANALPGIDVYDQEALTELLIRHQVGVRRMLLPIEYLDGELFNELTDAS